jgi:glycopeptide antibiotics resistance protein
MIYCDLKTKALWLYIIFTFSVFVIPLSDSINPKLQDSFLFEQIQLDHLFHGLLFMPLYSLLFLNLCNTNIKQPAFFAFFYGFSFSLVVELIQIPLVYRSFTLYDLIANFIGFIAGAIMFILGTLILRISRFVLINV